ncbi:MAG TPA: MBL fold metallo-hydrolase [Candidatus Limnocylindria bacterium]|nr:MBL fold metallo-hydrolase [Candidatus Limnocylindria bacterium]
MTRVRFIGSGDSFGSGGRFQTCILVDGKDYRFLIDCGATSLVALKRAEVDPSSIDAVLITHFHGDHCGGVPYLILDGQFAKRDRPLTIAGPPGTHQRMTAIFEAALPTSSRTAQRFPVSYVELGEQTTTVGPLDIVALPVTHLPETVPHGLRVRVDEHVVSYTGDTDWCDAIPRLADAAHLFIAEAYSFEKRIPQHLSHATLLAHRDELRAERVVLTHPGIETLKRASELAWPLANDGSEIVLVDR